MIPVVIEGRTAGTNSFRDETFTENVSRMGACIVAGLNLQDGLSVALHARCGEFECHAKARIAWVGKFGNQMKAGVRFLEPPKNWVVS